MKKIAIISALVVCIIAQATDSMAARRHHGHKHHHAKHHKVHKHNDPAYQN